MLWVRCARVRRPALSEPSIVYVFKHAAQGANPNAQQVGSGAIATARLALGGSGEALAPSSLPLIAEE